LPSILSSSKRLEAAGIPVQHAEAIAEAFNEATGDELVTKSDLDLKLAEIKVNLSDATGNVVKWVAGLLLAQAGLVAALVKLL
jgi:hypothetical protein